MAQQITPWLIRGKQWRLLGSVKILPPSLRQLPCHSPPSLKRGWSWSQTDLAWLIINFGSPWSKTSITPGKLYQQQGFKVSYIPNSRKVWEHCYGVNQSLDFFPARTAPHTPVTITWDKQYDMPYQGKMFDRIIATGSTELTIFGPLSLQALWLVPDETFTQGY